MKVTILGAGAIGSAYGYLLSNGGHEVTLVDVWAEHIEAIKTRGLWVESDDGQRVVSRLSAATDASAMHDAEAVLVLVKSFATEAAARSIEGRLGPGAIVVTLQNGIGNDAALARVLGPDPVVQGSTTVGAQMLAPGRVIVAPGTLDVQSLTVLGRPSADPYDATCERLAAALSASALPATVVDDVRTVVWRKMAMAAAIGPICAILQCTVAEVLERPPALALLRRTFDEIVAVAAAEDVALDGAELWSTALATYRSIGRHPPSLAVDVARGRSTEIETQLGEVERRGTAAGIATPSGAALAAILRAMSTA
jgi:2-dehydropantoate 2-reductase